MIYFYLIMSGVVMGLIAAVPIGPVNLICIRRSFAFGPASFLLQDFCAPGLAENFMMHLLVTDVQAWWQQVQDSGVIERYQVRCTPIEQQPWRMKDFCLSDPAGVLWRIGQNTD